MRIKKIIFLLLLLVFLSFTTGCLGGLFNNKPIIESTPEDTAKVGIEYTYEIEATDPDADDVLTYSLTEKPTGMTINTSTGAVSWTPTEAQVGEHQVIIEVSDGKVSVSQNFTITVAGALLSSIVVVPSEMTIYIGDSEEIISITAHYDNETIADIELDSDDVSYSSDDEEIATVTDLGVVNGESAGEAIITVSYTESYTEEDDITKTDTITVTIPPNLSYIKVLPEFMIIYEGNSQSITSIKAYYEGSTTPADIALNDASYEVDSTDTPDIITVNTSGVVTGVTASPDWQTITVTYTEGSITETDTVYVKVEPAPVILDSISVLPDTMPSLVVGQSGNITLIRANYSDGSHEDLELDAAGLVYSSSNEDVATIDIGVVTGQSVGTATIAVSYTKTGITKIDTIAVTVVVAE
jgi:hypothetical protein